MHDSYVKDIADVPDNGATPRREYSSSPNRMLDPSSELRLLPATGDVSQQVDDSIDLGLNDLTQEDKFFLIQQIEDLNKNIRYCQSSSAGIFKEDEVDEP